METIQLPPPPSLQHSVGACRLCSDGSRLASFVVRGVRLERCSACGFLQVGERPTVAALQDLYGPSYFDHGKYEDQFALMKENGRRLELLRSTGITRGATVLDAGCARGDFLSAASLEYEMWGVDVAESAVAEARRQCPAAATRVQAGFLEQLRFAPATFDAVVLWDVIEHVWDPIAVGRAVVSWLKPSGFLLLSTPNVGAATARLMGQHWPFMTVPEHLGLFNRESMHRLLEQVLGLRVMHWSSRGKWANVGFLAYKARRVAPRLIPAAVTAKVRQSPLGKLSVYVPTGDIQYVIARKS